jgi:hypothetical protein
MSGLDPGIHIFTGSSFSKKWMDCRVKPGNDGPKRFPGDCRIASYIVRGGGTVACRSGGSLRRGL